MKSRLASSQDKELETQAIVIGCGVAGICMGIHLKQAGIPFVILEKAERAGGTWRDNIYPGCGCDTESHQYCFSFEPNPNWSRVFARQPEILAYFEHCIEKYGLSEHIEYGQAVRSGHFDDKSGSWTVETAAGNTYQGKNLISAVGQLNIPHVPNFEGLDQFSGACFHSARWDNRVEWRGKRVAVIGNGATAIQLVPPLVEKVSHLALFQRSANWIVPKNDRFYSEGEKQRFRNWLIERFNRVKIYWNWEKSWPDFLLHSRRSRTLQADLRQAIADQVPDPHLAAKLTPDYPVGCKRILISDDYYRAVQAEHVEVIVDPIESFVADGIRTRSGREVAVDVIIMATGFKANDFLYGITLTGAGGADLNVAWADGAEAYLGITVPHFPNFFMLYGPNTNLAHNSIIFMIECQTQYIMGCIRQIISQNLHSMRVRPEAMRRYNEQLQRDLVKTVWAGSCSSWYKTKAGKIISTWSSTTVKYWWLTRRRKVKDYKIVLK